jgi:hypothetical protein
MDMGKLAAIASDSSMVERSGSLDNRVTESDVEELFQAFLGREVGNANYIRHLIGEGCTVRNLIKSLRGSEEFAFKQRAELNVVDARDMIREQFVMSCSVFGLEIEKACLALACEAVASGGAVAIKGKIKASGKNVLSMTVFENERFGRVDDNTWAAPSDLGLAVPCHISVAR